MEPASSPTPEDSRLASAVRMARRFKRERDEARGILADRDAQLEALQALLSGAFPPETEPT